MNEVKFTELVEQLRATVAFDHDGGDDGYQHSYDAMWKAAVAAFNWAAGEVGASGFQASAAALQFYSEVMHVEHGFMIVKIEDALYPQYDLPGRVREYIQQNRGWLAEEAQKKLDAYEADPVHRWTDDEGVHHTAPTAHPDVVAHWRSLVAAVLG